VEQTNPVYNTDGQTVNIVYSGATNGWIPISDDDVVDEGTTTSCIQQTMLVVAGGGAGGGGQLQDQYGGGGWSWRIIELLLNLLLVQNLYNYSRLVD
jgi:hypothetical protein